MKRRGFLGGAAGLAGAAMLPELARPAIAQGRKKISFLTWNIIDAAAVINGWIKDFTATRPGVEVEWLDKKGPDLPVFYQTQLAAGTPPDVINTQGALWLEYASDGALLDLTPYMAKHPDVKARFNADYLANWVYQGKNFMLPWYIAKTLLFYNKTMFKAAGLSGPAQSFDELMAQAEKMGGANTRGFITLNFDWLYWPLFKMNGIELLTPDLKKTAFDTPKMVEVVERLSKGTAGTAIDKISWTGRWVEPLGAFASGKIGMLHAHSPAYFFIKGQGTWINRDTLGVGQMPGYWSVPNSHGLGISKGSRDPDLAWEWISFITDAPQAAKLANDRKILSGNTEVDKALLARMKTEDPVAEAVLETQLEHTDRMCGNWLLGDDARVKEAFYPELQNALLGRKKPASAIKAADRKVSRVLRRG